MKKFEDTFAARVIKERWSGKDMERYFKEASEEFYNEFSQSMENKS